jgi:hypothetical protein
MLSAHQSFGPSGWEFLQRHLIALRVFTGFFLHCLTPYLLYLIPVFYSWDATILLHIG